MITFGYSVRGGTNLQEKERQKRALRTASANYVGGGEYQGKVRGNLRRKRTQKEKQSNM